MRGRGAVFKYLEAEPTPHDAGSTAQSMSRLAQNTFFTIIRYVERRLWLRPDQGRALPGTHFLYTRSKTTGLRMFEHMQARQIPRDVGTSNNALI